MMKIFYVIKWTLGSLLILLLLDLVVESAVVAPNQKGNQDGTKLSEQRLLPETSPALYVEEENHAPKLNQISRKRVKRGNRSNDRAFQTVISFEFCGKDVSVNICSCPSSSHTPRQAQDGLTPFFEKTGETNNEPVPCENKWINQTCTVQLKSSISTFTVNHDTTSKTQDINSFYSTASSTQNQNRPFKSPNERLL
ncbi:unnamed protein product [Clavelina lepadiformis]|uniref:Uncharacterized protein n=1 Tax=Clavelina lepadiformis TaxID=159417 RepID=A0ABP0FRA7_CLALP